MAASTRPSEIKALAGARALPPLILVLFHFCEGHGYRGAGWFDMPVGKGYLWVEFFFALSGFILVHVYGSRAREFWRGKAYRAVPAGAAVAALSAAYFHAVLDAVADAGR